MMHVKTLKLRRSPDLHIRGTTDGVSGRPLVIVDSDADLVEDILLGADEAERLGRALVEAAACARREAEAPGGRRIRCGAILHWENIGGLLVRKKGLFSARCPSCGDRTNHPKATVGRRCDAHVALAAVAVP